MNFSEHLREAMTKAGLTANGLGKLSRVSHTSIKRYLDGETPKPETARKLAAALNLNVQQMLYGDAEPTVKEDHQAEYLASVTKRHSRSEVWNVEKERVDLVETIQVRSRQFVQNPDKGIRDHNADCMKAKIDAFATLMDRFHDEDIPD